MIVIHDLAYADLVFDGYKAPSFLQVPGAKDVGVEFYTLPRPTTCQVGAWAFVVVIARSLERWPRSRVTSITEYSNHCRLPASLPSMDRKIV